MTDELHPPRPARVRITDDSNLGAQLESGLVQINATLSEMSRRLKSVEAGQETARRENAETRDKARDAQRDLEHTKRLQDEMSKRISDNQEAVLKVVSETNAATLKVISEANAATLTLIESNDKAQNARIEDQSKFMRHALFTAVTLLLGAVAVMAWDRLKGGG